MGNCCSIQYPKSTQEKYQQYKQNNRYACVNQSPLQWRKADKTEVKQCGESDYSTEDEKEESDDHHMSESCINDPQDWMKSQDICKDSVDVEQECLLAPQPVAQNKKMVKIQQRPNEPKVIARQKSAPPSVEKKSSECSSHTSHSSIQDSSDAAETKKLIEKRETAVKSTTEISVRPKSRKTFEKPIDTTDGNTETPHKKLSNALNTDKSLFVALDSGRDSDKTNNLMNSDASKCHSLPSKHKNKLPNVIKREKKSVEELIEAFKNDNSLIRAPCKEYLSDNLFEEAKLQHHQVLVSTLLPKYTPNTSFGSGRSGHGMEQSTFDIADIDSEDRSYNSKNYQHFRSMEVLHPVSTPKIESKVKPKIGKGKIQLFDIGGFEDIAVGDAAAKSRISLSSISQSSERKMSVKSFQFDTGDRILDESVDSVREPAVEPANLSSNNSFKNEDSLTNENDIDSNDCEVDEKKTNETFNISNASAKSVESKSENTTPRKMYEAKLVSDCEDTPPKKETSFHSDYSATTDKSRKSSSKSFTGNFGYNDRKESEKSERDHSIKSKDNSDTQPQNDSTFGDYPPLEISDKESLKDDDEDDYFDFLKQKSAAPEYDNIFGRSKKTMRSRDRGLNVLGKKKSESDEFENFKGDPFARGGLKRSPPRGYTLSASNDCDEEVDDFISNFNSLSGNSPKCKRSSASNYAQLDFDDYGQKDDVFGDKSDEENKQPGDEGRSFRINNHVKVSKKGLSIEALGCELNLGKKVQLSLFNGKKSMLI